MPGSPLATYLDAREETSESFAARLGVGQSTVWRWREGERTPRIGWALAIERATDGAVPVSAWRDALSAGGRSVTRQHDSTSRTSEAGRKDPRRIVNKRARQKRAPIPRHPKT